MGKQNSQMTRNISVEPEAIGNAVRPSSYRNKYYIIQNRTEFYELTPDIKDKDIRGSRYYIRAFRHLEATSTISGKIFIVVELGTEELPAYGDDVIVFVVSDFFQKIPVFADRVGMIFKGPGLKPRVNCSFAFDYLTLLMWLRFCRSVFQNLLSRLAIRRSAQGPIAPTFSIPLGDRDVWDLDIIPVLERSHDVSFLGSIVTNQLLKLSVTGLLGTPKTWSRSRMFAALKHYAQTRPSSVITLKSTSFAGGNAGNSGPFSELLADTKICVVPRGDVPETYRYFQGLRYGCVVVAEELPDEWFYTGSPAVTVRNWSELPALLDKLLADPDLMRRKSEESLAWWRDVVSEAALARYVIKHVEAHG